MNFRRAAVTAALLFFILFLPITVILLAFQGYSLYTQGNYRQRQCHPTTPVKPYRHEQTFT